jgi:uncharacterized protein
MRLVLDTNTVVSGLLWGGNPGQIMDAGFAGRVNFISSPALLCELTEVLSRRKFAVPLAKRGISADRLMIAYAALVRIVVPAQVIRVVERDPDDDDVIAAAFHGRADFVVSGDKDILEIGEWRGIKMVNASDAAGLIAASTQ